MKDENKHYITIYVTADYVSGKPIEKEPEKVKELQQKFDSWMAEMKADHSSYQFWKSINHN